MNENQIYQELTEVMRDVFDDDSLAIGPETQAPDVAGWDSQAHIQLIVAVEQRFRIRFRTSEFESLHNVGDFVSLIQEKLGEPCPPR